MATGPRKITPEERRRLAAERKRRRKAQRGRGGAQAKGRDASDGQNGGQRRRRRRIAADIIMAVLAVVILAAGFKVFTIVRDYRANRGVYDRVSEQARPADGPDDGIDFDALRAINPDIIGWLRYEGTPIDYPVVQGTDNDKYLKVMFDGTPGSFGTIFADCADTAPFRQFNTIVYGHHMKDGSMFAGLSKLKDQDWCAAHPYMELITTEGRYRLEVWAFLNQPSDSGIYANNISGSEEKAAYIALAGRLADYTTDVSVGPDDRLVLLSTCAYEYQDARYIVVCKMVPWE